MKHVWSYVGILAAVMAPFIATGCGNANLPAATASNNTASKNIASGDTAVVETAEKEVAQVAKPAAAEAKPSPTVSAAPNAEPPPRALRLPAKGNRLDLNFDDIKFEMAKNADYKRSMITPKIEGYDGREVQIRGYIFPTFQQTGLTQFVLVRDNRECCFGPGAALYDCIFVEMKPGLSANYTVLPVAVQGTFAVREFLDPDGKPLAIYHIDGQAVK